MRRHVAAAAAAVAAATKLTLLATDAEYRLGNPFRPQLARYFIMAALRSRCGHFIFAQLFLSIFFFYSSPNLSGCRLDVYHTLTHGVALVRI